MAEVRRVKYMDSLGYFPENISCKVNAEKVYVHTIGLLYYIPELQFDDEV